MTEKGRTSPFRSEGGKVWNRRIAPFSDNLRCRSRAIGAAVERGRFGDDDDDRKPHLPLPARTLEQGTADWPKASAEAEGSLDHSCSPAAGRTPAGARDVHPGHR